MVYSLSKLSTIIAPIDAGIAIKIIRFNAKIGSVINGNLFNANSTTLTTNNVNIYAAITRKKNARLRLTIFAWNTLW